MQVYTKRHLLLALQEAGLPYSYKSLIKYEKLGIIPREKDSDIKWGIHDMRFYTKKEIEQIVSKVKAYKNA